MTVKPGAIAPLEALYPRLRELPVHRREDGEHARYLPPPASIARDLESRYPVEGTVFPRFAPHAAVELRPISRLETLRRLLDTCLSLPVAQRRPNRGFGALDATAVVL